MFQINSRNLDQSRMPWCYVRRGSRIVREFCAVPMCKPDSKWKTSVFYEALLSDHCFCSFTGPRPTVKPLPAVSDTGTSEPFWLLFSLSALLWTRPVCLCRAVVWSEVWTEGQQNRERFFCSCRVTTMDCSYFWPSFPLWWFSHLALLGCYCCTLFWRVRWQKHLAFCCCSGVFSSFYIPEIFSPRHLLNNDTDILSVHLGKKATNETNAKKEQIFSVEKLIIHPHFDSYSNNNDIGV